MPKIAKSLLSTILILPFLVIACSKGNQPVALDDLKTNEQGLRLLKGELFTGEAVAYYAPNAVASIEVFKKGRRHGLTRKWFKNGQLGFEAMYQNGVREGVTRSWWFNGNLRSYSYFKGGKVDGEAWEWYRSGEKFKRFNYREGQPYGLQQAWRLNGKLFSNFEYKDGRIFGLRKANNCVGLENEKISVDYYRKQSVGL